MLFSMFNSSEAAYEFIESPLCNIKQYFKKKF